MFDDLDMTREQRDAIQAFIDEATDNGTHYSGMSYEDGLQCVLDIMDGNCEISEL